MLLEAFRNDDLRRRNHSPKSWELSALGNILRRCPSLRGESPTADLLLPGRLAPRAFLQGSIYALVKSAQRSQTASSLYAFPQQAILLSEGLPFSWSVDVMVVTNHSAYMARATTRDGGFDPQTVAYRFFSSQQFRISGLCQGGCALPEERTVGKHSGQTRVGKKTCI